MHIHGMTCGQVSALVPTQAAQQTIAAKRAAAETRRKLLSYAALTRVDGYVPGDRSGRRDPPEDQDAFRKILVSMKI